MINSDNRDLAGISWKVISDKIGRGGVVDLIPGSKITGNAAEDGINGSAVGYNYTGRCNTVNLDSLGFLTKHDSPHQL